jgi:hypothetical protein
MMTTPNPITMATRAEVNEWMLRFDVDYVADSHDYDFTGIQWCTDVINGKLVVCVPASYIEDDGYDGGFCLGAVEDVRLNRNALGGEKTTNITVNTPF